jgi:murein DD-endopeptidase MepM/ murein hydrolase activator NlpD
LGKFMATANGLHDHSAAFPDRKAGSGVHRRPLALIFERNEEAQYLRLRPALSRLVAVPLVMLLIAYCSATAYLLMRDGLLDWARTHHNAMLQGYEERIERLRLNLDRAVSRQLLQERQYVQRLEDLSAQKEILERRTVTLENLARAAFSVPSDRREAAGHAGIAAAVKTAQAPLPIRPKAAGADAGTTAGGLRGAISRDTTASVSGDQPIDYLIRTIDSGFAAISDRQRVAAVALRDRTEHRRLEIASILATLDLDPSSDVTPAVGGPYHPATGESTYDPLAELDFALDALRDYRDTVDGIPLSNPVAGHSISSAFGVRVDPFYGKRAMHLGVDFSAGYGVAVRAAAAGTVVAAGHSGGYGKMVVVDHGRGIRTRYAHLGQVLVEKGQNITREQVVGVVGSTGRSTGPHLHYEIRHHGKAMNPARFLRAGRALAALL